MNLRSVLGAGLGGAILAAGVVAGPAQAAEPSVSTAWDARAAAACSPHLETLSPWANSNGTAWGRVYIDESATPCSGKRIIVYAQTKNPNGSWSPLRGGQHWIPTDELGFVMDSQPIYAGCQSIVRSAYVLGSLTVTGTSYRVNC